MPTIQLKSYAKINLTLKITGLRKDGFHDLESIMRNVSIYDEISIEETPEQITIECENLSVPTNQKNICFKAADLIIKNHKIKSGIKINIIKNIPMEAGMGGGSSNAAAVLLGLNKLWDLKLSDQKLIEYAAELGSDVPFFIKGGIAMCKGRGEIVEQIDGSGYEGYQYIIIKPEVSVPTQWAYEEWDIKHEDQSAEAHLREGGKTEVGQGTTYECIGTKGSALICDPVIAKTKPEYSNNFQDLVMAKYPKIKTAISDLVNAGCEYAQMTGSGSAVFGICTKETSNSIFKKILTKHLKSFLASPVEFGVSILTD